MGGGTPGTFCEGAYCRGALLQDGCCVWPLCSGDGAGEDHPEAVWVPALRQWARSRLRRDHHAAEDAEDLAVAFAEHLLQHARRGAFPLRLSCPVPYLKQALRNFQRGAERHRLRHQSQERLFSELDEAEQNRIAGELGQPQASPGPMPLDPASRLELREGLGRLSPSSREMLVLHFVEGWTDAELGERFGLKPSTVRKRLSDVLRRLRRWLVCPPPE